MISFIAAWHSLVCMISFIMCLSYNLSRVISFIVVWHHLFRTISFIVFLLRKHPWTSSSTLVSLSPPISFCLRGHFLVSTLVPLSPLSFSHVFLAVDLILIIRIIHITVLLQFLSYIIYPG